MLLDWCRAKTRSYEVRPGHVPYLCVSYLLAPQGRFSHVWRRSSSGLVPSLILWKHEILRLSSLVSTWISRTSRPAGATAWPSALWCITSSPKPSTTARWAPVTADTTSRWPSARPSEWPPSAHEPDDNTWTNHVTPTVPSSFRTIHIQHTRTRLYNDSSKTANKDYPGSKGDWGKGWALL